MKPDDPSIPDLLAMNSRLKAELDETYRSITQLTNELEVQKEKLELLSFTDELTGLYNRRALMDRLVQEMLRSERHGSGLTIMLLDLDHFKQVNDTHGHLLGDEVLATFGRVIAEIARGSDAPARYGGEEFCVLLPETNLEGTLVLADRLRLEIARQPFPGVNGTTFHVTCSIGIAQFLPGQTDTVSSLLERADVALYAAKEGGRNCIRVSDAPQGGVPQPLILIVDDEEQVLSLTKRTLEELGYRVLTADNGQKAIELLSQNATEIAGVLLDLCMLRADGIKTSHAIEKVAPHLPIIVISGDAEEEARSHITEGRVVEFVQKPYRPHELNRILLDAIAA